jgi:hypothetical protein
MKLTKPLNHHNDEHSRQSPNTKSQMRCRVQATGSRCPSSLLRAYDQGAQSPRDVERALELERAIAKFLDEIERGSRELQNKRGGLRQICLIDTNELHVRALHRHRTRLRQRLLSSSRCASGLRWRRIRVGQIPARPQHVHDPANF